jgi:flagellar basal-body rod modification protein FlgD
LAESSDMAAAAISSLAPGNQLPASLQNKSMALNANDFIKMMVTQLQNQDPLQPTGSDQLLSQMSQIGQLQSATDLQASLKGLVLQNQIGAAGNLIGKSVSGTDANSQPAQGIVDSVRVGSDGVFLELHNGQELPMANVTAIAPAPAVVAQQTTTTTPTTTPTTTTK